MIPGVKPGDYLFFSCFLNPGQLITGTSKAWLGDFGEIGHPVDTDLFATKAYVDAQIGGAMGLTLTLSIPGVGGDSHSYTQKISLDTGFDISNVLASWSTIGISGYQSSSDFNTNPKYATLAGQTDAKIYVDQNASVSGSNTEDSGQSFYCTMKITLNNDNTLTVLTSFSSSGAFAQNRFNRDAFTLTVVAYK